MKKEPLFSGLAIKRDFLPYFWLVVPALVVYIMFFLYPVMSSFLYSFTNFNGFNLNYEFRGLKNYRVLFGDPVFRQSISHTFIFGIFVVVLQNLLAIFFAVTLNKNFVSKNLLRTLLFMPVMISPVIVGYIWQFLYSTNGLINYVLSNLFNRPFQTNYLSDGNTALMAVVITHVWIWIGYSATIYLANLQNIPSDLIENANLEGCTGWNRFRYIIWPLLAPATTVSVSLSVGGSLRVFDIIYVMTGGGPGYATETIATFMVKAMQKNLFGYAASSAVILLILVLLTTRIMNRYLRSREIDL